MNVYYPQRIPVVSRRWFRLALPVCLALTLAFLLTPAVSAKTNEGGVLRATLKNDLKVVIVPNHLAPAVTTMMNYRVGGVETPEGFPGMAHAQEHMMFRGSPGLSASQLAAISDAMGGRFNAQTQQSVTQYFFTVPASDLQVALHIQAVRMRGVKDTEKLWKKERGAIKQEVARDLSDPSYVFYKKLLAHLFKGTPYAQDALGTQKSFDETTGKMLHKFYDNWYAPNNATLVIVGDVEPKKTLEKVKSLFADIPTKKLPSRPEIKLQPVKPAHLSLPTDKPYGLSVVAFRTPGYDSADYAATRVLARVLSSQRGRLYSKLVPNGKALAAGFQLQTFPQAGVGFAYGVFPKGGDGKKLLENMKQLLKKDVKSGIPESLVKAAKRREATIAAARKDSISGLARAWSQALTVEGRHSPDQIVQEIEQVSTKDVEKAARRYLNQGHAVTAVLTPQGGGTTENAPSKGTGKESFAPKNAKPVKLPDWAQKHLNTVSVPPRLVKPSVSTLKNGIKLIVQQENTSNTVRVYGHIRNKPGLSEPQGQEGITEVLDSLFPYGTDSLGRLAFHKALDKIGAAESAGTDFSLTVLKPHFDDGVMLLADNELHPGLPKKPFQVVRQKTAAQWAGKLQSPDFLAGQALKKALYPKGDPKVRHPSPESVSSLKLKNVRAYHNKVFRPDETTIVVIGNISPKAAKRAIKKYFGDWKAKGPKPDTNLPEVPPNKAKTVFVPDPSRVQDSVTLSETMGLTRSNPDYYALKMGNYVLSRGFYASRLYKELRQRRGLVYFVVSSIDANKTRSHFAVDYASEPSKVSEARSVIIHNLDKMQNKLIGNDELHRVRAELVRGIPLSQSSQSSIAHQLLYYASHDLPLDEPHVAAERYMKLGPKDIKAAYAKWLRPKDFVQVTQGPKKKQH